MAAADTPLVSVRRVERGNGSRASQDRIFTTDQAVVVLDGASQPEATAQDGGWLADQLGSDITRRLQQTPSANLADTLHDSIAHVADLHQLTPGTAPSATVSIIRWNATTLDVLVLCDSPVVVLDRAGHVQEVRDDRLANRVLVEHESEGFVMDDLERWRKLVASQRQARNQPGGYWVAETTPTAAHHAVQARWPINNVAAVLAMTDGVSIGVEQYGIPATWSAAIELAAKEPNRLINAIHEAETSDPHGQRWPRSKRHDDKALVLLQFDTQG